MHRSARALSSLALVLTLAACQLPGGTAPGKPGARTPGPVAPRGGSLASVATLVGFDGATLIGLDAASLVGADGATLIGADGATLVGPDGASLIGPDGASLIGADGASITGSVRAPAGLVAAGAGNAVSDMGGLYRLSALAEQPLAGVHVYLRTASGKFVVDKAGKPIQAVTDARGEFTFKGWRAARGLSFFVPAARVAGELQGLAGLRARDQAESAPVAIDVASTLMASWIYERVLTAQADRAASLDRLPAALGAATQARVAAALRAEVVPTLGDKRFADALERLRGEDQALGAQLDEVRRVMTLAGTDSTLTAHARAITLQQPVDVVQGPDGALYVAEAFGGVVRRIDQAGQATVVIGQGSQNEGTIGALFPTDLAFGPDGKLYVNSRYSAAIFRCDPDGANFERFAGGGGTPVGPGVRALDAQIEPALALAFDTTGGLLIAGDESGRREVESRIFRVAPDGTIAALPSPWAGEPPLLGGHVRREVAGLAVASDGATWCLEFQEKALWLQEPNGAWRVVARDVLASDFGDLLPQADGSVLVSLGRRRVEGEHVIDRFTRAGVRSRFAGTGELGTDPGDLPATRARLADPAGLAAGRDGSVLLTDLLAGLVRAIGPDGLMRTIAGRTTGADVAALAEPLNVPGGIAIDAQGRVIVSEFAGHSIRRIEGERSVRIAGGEPGITAEGARADRLYSPAGLAFHGEDIIVVEQGAHRVVRIRPDGRLETIAGGGVMELNDKSQFESPPAPRDIWLREPLAVAVSPEGQVYFNDSERIWRVALDGRTLELVAGWESLEGQTIVPAREGQLAREVPFGKSTGMVFDPQGNLYVSEVFTSQIIKIDKGGRVSVYAGVGSEGTLLKLVTGAIEGEGEVAARDAAFVVPSGLAFDAAGNLYVTEMGTRGVQALASGVLGDATALPLVDGRIRKIDTSGRVTTIAGLGGPAGTALRNPVGLVVDRDGRVVFVDNGTNQLKRL